MPVVAQKLSNSISQNTRRGVWVPAQGRDDDEYDVGAAHSARVAGVARMERSEIRDNAANGSADPGLRFAPSGLRPSLRANGSRECAPDDRLCEAIQLCRRDQESWIASSRCSSQ